MRRLRTALLLAALAAAGCGDQKSGVTPPAQVAPAPDKSDPGLKGDSAPGPP